MQALPEDIMHRLNILNPLYLSLHAADHFNRYKGKQNIQSVRYLSNMLHVTILNSI
jgi:hypothetical protein